jgi:DNA-binding transcriptional ArsR family regulator
MTETRSPKRQARKRQARLKHRRSLAAGFTLGERAALHIIADECRAHGCCAMTIAELATRAGVGRTTVKNVLRKAREDGLITLERRRRTSIVRIISPAWLVWLERHRNVGWPWGCGGKSPPPRLSRQPCLNPADGMLRPLPRSVAR